MSLKIMLDEGACLPTIGHPDDAGIDLCTPYFVTVPMHGSAVIDTGVHIQIPKGYYGKLESKSGLNVKHDIVCCGGVIDAGYTGSIVVKLYNLGLKDYSFYPGDKIVQLVIVPCVTERIFEVVKSFEDTERGADGFGSTGR